MGEGVRARRASRERFDEAIKGSVESGMLTEAEATVATATIEKGKT